MPLATKSGSLIVKSGSIAENCGCCAGNEIGWVCCITHKECDIKDISAIKLDITSEDWFQTYREGNFYISEGSAGGAINGVIELPASSSTPFGKVWATTVASSVRPFTLNIAINVGSPTQNIPVGTYRAFMTISISTRALAYVGDSYIEFEELRSRANVSASTGLVREIRYAECDALDASVVSPITFYLGTPVPGQESTTGSHVATLNSLEYIT